MAGVDPESVDDVCFTTEAFCSLFAETALKAESVPEYIDKAVAFANQYIWRSLNATIIVHPKFLKDAGVKESVERAIANLRYGTVGINIWAGAGFTFGTTNVGSIPWS